MTRELPAGLPADRPNQVYVTLSALEAGYLYLPEREFITNADPTAVHRCPSLAFYIYHGPTQRKIVYDLGLRKDWDNYPPRIAKRIATKERRVDIPADVHASLLKGGVRPEDIDTIILSHIHYDHTGNPHHFPNAKFILGPGSLELIRRSEANPAESWFGPTLLPDDISKQVTELSAYSSSEWVPLSVFPHTVDYFGDGSFYLVDSPGHLEGHINGLARIGSNKFVYLASDTCHDTRILSGECGIAVYEHDGVMKSVDVDKEASEGHIRLLQDLMARTSGEVEIVLAHDFGWEKRHEGRFLPGKFE